MKVVFFSESQINGKIPRDFSNARTEYAWMMALDAPHYNINNIPSEKFDLGIVIIPKNNPNINLNSFRVCCDKVAVMQEGPHWFFQDYTVEQQFHYYNTLMDADWVYCHNESDVNYYLGLGCKDVRVMRSLMIPDGLEKRNWLKSETMIGGNFVSWYGGFDSYMVAREMGDPISCPSMGRKQEQESLIEDINYLPYMSWRDWIKTLGEYNIGIHLMRTHAAGTFAMNCGFHGIPCVGYRGLDTQELLHPLTTVDVGDLDEAKRVTLKLKDDKFYKLCSSTISKRFNQYYTEDAWKENWRVTNK
tara:strand:+ start:10799 stop:11707 length:909 start_codon:yes stop_codon:yes gene_type:complete